MIDLSLGYELKFSEAEMRAYKLHQLWHLFVRKIFPNIRHTKPKTGDPRKKNYLFKLCYKLQQERLELLPESEYSLYVRAQLEIIKNIDPETPLIVPNCLVGDKAWVRWKIWRKKYVSSHQVCQIQKKSSFSTEKILADLKKTKEFLIEKYGSLPSKSQIDASVENKELYRWCNLKRITPYYLVMCPWTKELNIQDHLTFDLGVYREQITKDIEEKFHNLFAI